MSIQGDILTQINKSITGVTEHTRAHPDDFNPNVLKPLLDNDVTINRQLEALPSKPISFNPGYQIVESEHDAPFRLGEIKGRTLVNLNGRRGNFNYRTLPLPTDGATGEIVQSNFGKVQKVVSNRNTNTNFSASYELNIDRSKHYIAMAYMENISCTKPVQFYIAKEYSLGSIVTLSQSKGAENSSGMHYLYATVDPKKMDDSGKLIYYFTGVGTAGAEFLIGSFAFYEIPETEYYTIATMTPEQVAARYPYIDDMTNVCNPYAIVTGGNLLPPFMEWTITGTTKIISPYEISRASTGEYQDPADSPAIEVIPGETYYVQYSPMNDDLFCEIREGDDHNNMVGTKSLYGGAGFSFIPMKRFIRVRFSSKKAANGTFKNPMLTIGTEPNTFVTQQRSMIAFETELAAHPVDGSNPDTLFLGDDGLPYVLEAWKKIRLDDPKLKYDVFESFPDRKSVISSYGKEFGIFSQFACMTKYTGNLMGRYGALGTPIDYFYIDGDVNGGNIVVSVANTDSGWGPNYQPEPDEINAYFLGWKMYDNIHPDNPHNGAGKAWIKITCRGTDGRWSSAPPDARLTTPVALAGIDSNGRVYTPYRLQYLKAKPTVEPVRNYELGATLSSGSNMVEVGSGIVLREKANPALYADNYVYLNNKAVDNAIGSNCSFSYKASTLLELYKDKANEIRKWTMLDKHDSAYGDILALIPQSNYDPTAVYHVTYTMLDPTLATPISGTVAANLRGTVTDLVQDVGDVQRRLSVVETQKANVVDDTGWIAVTPLSGWIQYEANPCMFRIIGKTIHMAGLIRNGSTAHGTDLFTLPVKTTSGHYISAFSWSNPEGVGPISIGLGASGTVRINSGTPGRYISFEGVVLLDESVEVKKS
ncbi:hypothetical protein [Paenibacillus dendritiformis]|uniref:hypothetical protein n=1 Tax=Paenibacillus dendritiformis TaxID=130049 RepID=UPI000DA957DA|nr:hypothetical protein [Paenibacillus dendritiformis]PZM67490.1 hypothetical protein DOE73_01425 [Paenibacillus dendritiformis]